MKRTLMIGVAAGALLAGVNIAASQGTMERGGANIEQKSGAQPGAQQQKGRSGAEMKADSPAGKARAQAQEKSQPQDNKAQDNKKSSTTGQSGQGMENQKSGNQEKAGDQKAGDQQKASDQKAGDQKAGDRQRAQDTQKTDTQKGAQSKPDAKSGTSAQGDNKSGSTSAQSSGGGGKVSLNTEQKTKIRETVIRSSNAPRVTNVNFSVSVGTVVPRTVRFAPLPPLLVEINPGWRSYEYFIVNEQIVIIEPGSLKIIAILDV